MGTIKLISERWLAGRKQTLSITRGEESRKALEAEIADAEKHLAAKNVVVNAAAKLGYKVNSYDGLCVKTGAAVKPSQGFVKKNAAGKWDTYAFAVVQAEVGHPGVEN